MAWLVDKVVFPAPAPTYTTDGPLRQYLLEGGYYIVDREDPEDAESWPWAAYGAQFFSCEDVPCILMHNNGVASQCLIYCHANHEDMWREHAVCSKLTAIASVISSD